MNDRALIEQMINFVQKEFEPHCVGFCWEVRQSDDESAYRVDVFIDCPLCEQIEKVVLVFYNDIQFIEDVKDFVIHYTHELIKNGAKLYGYKYKTGY
jgi:hypothetical protein